MDILTLILWFYLLPMMVVILPGALAYGKFDDMEGVTKTDVQILAILPILNLYTAFCILDVVFTSIVSYVKTGR